MAVYQDPRLINKPNKTDVLDGGVELQPQEAVNAPTEPSNNAQPTPQTQSQNSPGAAIKAPKAATRSGMNTNINSYINKNKPAAQNMASSIGDKVQKTADIARKNIQNVQQQFSNIKDTKSLSNRENAVQEVIQAANTASKAQMGQKTTNEQADKRLREILDTSYKGPKELREIGSYGQAQSRSNEAQRLTDQLTGNAQDRNELLNKTLERQGAKYTAGAKRLDELLFGQQDTQNQLKQRQEQIGNVAQDFRSAEDQSRQEAINRSQELDKIRQDSRKALTDISQDRSKAIEDYLSQQLAQGKELSDYYSDVFKQDQNIFNRRGDLDLGAVEAATLGLKNNAGLYNLLNDKSQQESLLNKIQNYDSLSRDKLITKDRQNQLAELQRLASLSKDYGVADSGLDFRNKYTDADLAGTQTALDAVDLQGIQNEFTEAEKNFRSQAANDITTSGWGSKSYNKGLGRRGRAKETAYHTANLKDILQKQGYDFNSDPSKLTNKVNPDMLSDLANLSRAAKRENLDVSDGESILDYASGNAGEDNFVLDKLGLNDLGKLLTAGGQIGIAGDVTEGVGKGIGDISRGLERSFFGGENNTIGNLLTDPTQIAAKGVQDLGREISNAGGAIFGSGKAKAKRQAKAAANAMAARRMKDALQGALGGSGFSNRVNIKDNETTRGRQRSLLDILGKIDTTNKK